MLFCSRRGFSGGGNILAACVFQDSTATGTTDTIKLECLKDGRTKVHLVTPSEDAIQPTTLLDVKGIEYLRPAGTFYLWVRVDHVSNGDVAAWAEGFLREKRVAISPGSAFGRTGEGWIRVSLAANRDELLAGLDLLPGRTK